MRARRWAAVVVGFIGVLVIVRPGSDELHRWARWSRCRAAVLSGIVAIQIKQLSRTEPADRIVLWTTMLWVPMSLLPALFVWEWPQGITWLWVAAAGVLGTGGAHAVDARAEARRRLRADADQLHAAAGGRGARLAAVRRDADRWTVLGAAIIFGANAYIAHREATLARKHATTAPTEAAQPNE